MKKIKLLAFLFLIASAAIAQMPSNMPSAQAMTGSGKVSGIIVDSVSKKPVEFATLAIYKKNDLKKPIDGGITDEKGKFNIKNIQDGDYVMKITSIGYSDKSLNFLISPKNQNVDLGNIDFGMSSKLLEAVTVTGQAAIIEERVDRMIYNADKDLSSKGGDAGDVLRKVPLLTVDLDGNVSMRGSSNIRVLINNKPSTILASSVADALKQIPADQIKTVEVITSPSAKYDAEGSGGIINIITKKNNLEGFTMNFDSGIGNRASNLGLNSSLRKGKFGMTLGGFGRAGYNKAYSGFVQNTFDNSNNVFKTTQDGTSKDNMIFGRYSLGMDYDISKSKSLSGGARFGTRNFNRYQTLDVNSFLNNVATSNSLRDIETTNSSNNWDFNLDYLHIIKPQKEFSISTQYSTNGLTNDFTNAFLGSSGEKSTPFSNVNYNSNQELTFQTDYQTPIKKNQIFEIGAKAIFRSVNSDYEYQDSLNKKIVNDVRKPFGSLKYFQNVAAGYISYTYSTKNKYTFKLGTRYEYTEIGATQNQTTKISIPAYYNLVPSVNISKTIGGKYTLKTAYNRRIQRPGLEQLNPNLNISNPQSYSQGNPALSPEIADNFEIGLSASIKKVYFNIATYARLSNNSINQVRVRSDTLPGVIITTYQNIGQEKAYGFNWNGNVSITSKWMLNGGVEGFYNYLNGQGTALDGTTVTISNQGWNFNGRLMSMWTIKNGWQVQAFSFMRGGRVQLQGRQGGFGFYSLGIRKESKDKKKSLGLAADNFLTNGFKIRTTLESPTLTQSSFNHMYNNGVRLTFSYKFGQMQMAAPKKKKSVDNNDIKEGGDGGNQQQGAGGQGGGRG